MYRARKRPFNKNILFVRIYISVMTLMLITALMALLSQSVKAQTYVITDGDRVVTYTSFEKDPQQVLDRAGVDLKEFDTYTTGATEAGEAITVNRADAIYVHYHGQTTVVSGNGETAGELLSRLGLEITGEDVVCPGLEEVTSDGMEITVDRVVTCRESYTVAIPHEVRRCSDDALPEGTEQVLLEGTDGELLCTAEVTYKNGVETRRQVLSENVTVQPVTEIIGIGTGQEPVPEEMPVIGDGYIRLPTGEMLTYTDTATVRATAYTQTDPGCDGITATGTNVRRGAVAVDPRYIPYGTRMFVMTPSGSYVYGIAVAEDCGGDIKGDRMDLYLPTYEECREFGRRVCTVYFLG